MLTREEIAVMLEGEDFYQFDEELWRDLAEALQYLESDDVAEILDQALFTRYAKGEGSWHLPAALIRGRSVVLLDPDSLKTPADASITILHEAAHAVLGHGSDSGQLPEAYRRQEREAWEKVRHWMPAEFHDAIDAAEQQGAV